MSVGSTLQALCGRKGYPALRQWSAGCRFSRTALALGTCDVVIDLASISDDIGHARLRKLESLLAATAVLLIVTSHRTISPLAKASARGGRLLGLAMPSPSGSEPLAEIIRSPLSAGDALSQVEALLRSIGCTTIVVNDSPGFYSGRVSGSYLNEGMALLGDGVPAQVVESAGVDIGMPSGPLALLDEMSLELSDNLHQDCTNSSWTEVSRARS